jgi:endoglucanase
MKPILLLAIAVPAFAAAPTTEIKIDQAGYLNGAPKVAFVSSKSAATEFTVRRAKDNAVAFRGKLAAPADDADSGDRVQAADFTKLARSGKYYLDVPGIGRSWDFEIGPNVDSRAWYLAMRSYYGQRCGIAVDLGPGFPGYKHEACHLEGAYHASSGPHASS